MTKEEFATKWVYPGIYTKTGKKQQQDFLVDLNSVIRDELIKFCQITLSPDIIGDEIIFVDEYLNEQR